jgi:hypothetical protein
MGIRRLLTVLMALGTMALFVAGCGGDDDDDDTAATEATTTEEAAAGGGVRHRSA